MCTPNGKVAMQNIVLRYITNDCSVAIEGALGVFAIEQNDARRCRDLRGK